MRDFNAALAGTHAFQRAGLGVYPFRCLHVEKRDGGCCQLCGVPLVYHFVIEDAEGHRFSVGYDCAERTGDAGLVRTIKNSAEYREIQRQKRAKRDEAVQAELETLLANPVLGRWADHYRNRLRFCGASGRARMRKEIREWMAKLVTADSGCAANE